MLAAVLQEIRKKVSSGYRTPVQMLVETLAFAGRAAEARKIALSDDIFIKVDGVPLRVDEFLAAVNRPERGEPMPPDYGLIAQKLLLRP